MSNESIFNGTILTADFFKLMVCKDITHNKYIK